MTSWKLNCALLVLISLGSYYNIGLFYFRGAWINFSHFCIFTGLISAGVDDNEVASKLERKLWQKKWKLPLISKLPTIKNSPSPPTWADSYICEGVLHLPYAEIDEPFYAWVDLESGNSRIDYYGGNFQENFFSRKIY